ncbi:hypothetical protein CBL_12111 [Carabus blaptoides fortunei]
MLDSDSIFLHILAFLGSALKQYCNLGVEDYRFNCGVTTFSSLHTSYPLVDPMIVSSVIPGTSTASITVERVTRKCGRYRKHQHTPQTLKLLARFRPLSHSMSFRAGRSTPI